MKHWIRLFTIAVLAVSIPIQGFAAVMMPACNPASMMVRDSMAMEKVSISMDAVTTQSAGESDCCQHNHESHKTPEQKCYICHLSVYQLPAMGLLVVADDATTVYHDLISQNYHTVHPPLFHPPKSTSA